MWASKHAPQGAAAENIATVTLKYEDCQRKVSKTAFAEVCPKAKEHARMDAQVRQQFAALMHVLTNYRQTSSSLPYPQATKKCLT